MCRYTADAFLVFDLFLDSFPARQMSAASPATIAQPTTPETDVPAALSLPEKL